MQSFSFPTRLAVNFYCNGTFCDGIRSFVFKGYVISRIVANTRNLISACVFSLLPSQNNQQISVSKLTFLDGICELFHSFSVNTGFVVNFDNKISSFLSAISNLVSSYYKGNLVVVVNSGPFDSIRPYFFTVCIG